MKISVSYLKSMASKEETIKKICETTCDYIHIDLIDGVFVGEKNYSIGEVLRLLKYVTKPLDMHLMVQNPSLEIEAFSVLRPEYITIHKEIPDLEKQITKIKAFGIKCGLAINPDTPIEDIYPYLKDIDLVLIMSVYPGLGGQEFRKKSIQKCAKLSQIKKEEKLSFLISIDGGINNKTKDYVKNYVDMLVSGSFVCMSENYEEKIQELS